MCIKRVRLAVVFIFLSLFYSANAQKTFTLSADETDAYTEQSRQIIAFLEGTLNFLGDPQEIPSEKDIIINQSYLKFFLNEEVQVEDDLDAHRIMPLNKDVQAYLKDVVFFYKNIFFTFEINKIEQLVNQNGQVYFKVTMNRNLQGLTIDNEKVSNNVVRFVEINLDAAQKDLKIVSIYSTKLNEKEEIKYWWEQMPEIWKNYFGSSVMIQDTIPFASVLSFNEKTFFIERWVKNVRIDTVANTGDLETIGRDADTVIVLGDKVLLQTTHYLKMADSFPADVSFIYKTLQQFRSMQVVDISGNKDFVNLNPLSELADLREINLSGTMIQDLSPLRNLNNLQKLNLSATPISTLDPLRYASSLKEINAANTKISNIDVLIYLINLDKLNLKNTKVESLEAITALENLQQLNLSGLANSDLNAIGKLPQLSDLNIARTQITNLEVLQTLANLQNLNLDSTSVSDLTPLAGLSKLTILQINNTPVSDLMPLAKLSSLKFIYCDNTKIDRTKAEQFMKANPGSVVIYNSAALKEWWNQLSPEWKAVNLAALNFSEPINKEQLHLIINQTKVNVADNPDITDLEPLKMMHRLEILNCENTQISKLEPLGELNNLRELNISRTSVVALEPLNGLLNLKTVNCEKTEISDLLPLLRNADLQLIYCDSTQVSQQNVLTLQQTLPECLVVFQTPVLLAWWNSLNDAWKQVFTAAGGLRGNPTPEELQKLVDLGSLTISENAGLQSLEPLTYFKRLTELSISNSGVTDIAPLTTLTSLTELSLSNNPLVRLDGITSLTNLVSLNLENTSIADLEVIGQLTWLKSLNIAGTKIKKLKGIETMTSLETLVLNNTAIKSLKGVEAILGLKELTCYRTAITSKNIETFKSSYPAVKVVYY